MSYRMQAPLVDELLQELGFDPKEGLGGMVGQLSADIDKPAANGKDRRKANAKPAHEEKPARDPDPEA